MKLRLSALLVLLSWTFLAHAEVLDFESPVVDSCGGAWGLSPTGWTVEGETAKVADDAECGDINSDGAYSGKQYLINYNERVGTLTRNAGAFDLNGAYVHADDRAGPATIDFAGYDAADTLLYSTTVVVGTDWQWVALDWPGITTFTWDPTTPDSTNITIDDLTFNAADAVPVPALGPYGLIVAMLGVLLIAGFRLYASSRRA